MRQSQRPEGQGGLRQILEEDDDVEDGQRISNLGNNDLASSRDLLQQAGKNRSNPRLERLIANTKLKLPRPFR